jgi:hypothetical protein
VRSSSAGRCRVHPNAALAKELRWIRLRARSIVVAAALPFERARRVRRGHRARTARSGGAAVPSVARAAVLHEAALRVARTDRACIVTVARLLHRARRRRRWLGGRTRSAVVASAASSAAARRGLELARAFDTLRVQAHRAGLRTVLVHDALAGVTGVASRAAANSTARRHLDLALALYAVGVGAHRSGLCTVLTGRALPGDATASAGVPAGGSAAARARRRDQNQRTANRP